MEYLSMTDYVMSATTLQEKIVRIDTAITTLETAMINSASKEYISEYSLDDGQTKIRTVYRGVEAIAATMNVLNRLRTMYENKLIGRSVRLVDGKNFV